jgi:uncharacterized protein (TIGR02996 family)
MSHPALTDEDKTFLRAIMSNPVELTAWLVYADWLDEHDDPRAEFIRLEVRHGQLNNTELEWYSVEERLQELRAALDPDWIAIFDRPKIEVCESAFRFQCPKRWENLKGTDDPTVRHCEACEKKVHYCRTLPEAQSHARQGHCVAVQLGVLRYPDDLKPRVYEDREELCDVMGMFNVDFSPPEPPRRRAWWKFW